MLTIDEFSAWVTVDGVELSQYSVEQSTDDRTATCWIASQVDKVSSYLDPSFVLSLTYLPSHFQSIAQTL